MSVKYSKDHEWVRIEGDSATVGITDFAQNALGDIVYVELPEAGRQLAQGKAAAVVESVKAASDVYAPLSGAVTEVNGTLQDDPALVNSSPRDKGWLFKMKPSDLAEFNNLMDEAGYTKLTGE